MSESALFQEETSMMMSVIERVKSVLRREGRSERKRFGALDAHGSEKLDSTPMQPPVGYNPQPSMFEVMRKMIQDHQRELQERGFETAEEADDFDVDDDYDPTSPYEHEFDPPADPSAIPSEVPPPASREAKDPPADGPGTPPADATAGAASGAASPVTPASTTSRTK